MPKNSDKRRPPAIIREHPNFTKDLSKYGTRKVDNNYDIFLDAKEERPPNKDKLKLLKDHPFTGDPLKGFRECHLDHDVILVYTDKDDVVTVYTICTHAEIKKGAPQKALSKKLKALVDGIIR